MKNTCVGMLMVVAVLLVGCSNTPPNYYVLHAAADPVSRAPDTFPAESQVDSIGVDTIELPTYLDKTRLVRRTGDNTLEVYQNDQWSEPLDAGVQRVLVNNLIELLPGLKIRRFPWPRGFRPDYRITIEIARFDADAEGNVLLSGRWWADSGADSDQIPERVYSFNLNSEGDTHADVAAAMSQALAELATAIAQEFR